MLNSVKNSRTISHLLYGFSIFLILLLISWFVTSNHLKEQISQIESIAISTEKMHVLSGLIEIVRKRTLLSHEMLMADDVFVKDEISIEIGLLAGQFIQLRQKLVSLELSQEEKRILDSQLKVYPEVIKNLQIVTELALADTEEATEQARKLIVFEIVPAQDVVMGGFTRLNNVIEEQVHEQSQVLTKKYRENRRLRLLLLFFILFVSVLTLIIVIRNVLDVEHKLRNLSTTDGLTGISNRRFFNTRIQQVWENSSRSNKPISVLLIDIDHFKKYNDYYGHQEGDKCLVKVAEIISGIAYRSGDIVARYGGEEFAVVLSNVDESGAMEVADRLLKKVRQEEIPHQGSGAGKVVTISIGCGSMIASEVKSVEELIKIADESLYLSKKAGRDRVSCI